jgi:hypothetical protein
VKLALARVLRISDCGLRIAGPIRNPIRNLQSAIRNSGAHSMWGSVLPGVAAVLVFLGTRGHTRKGQR